MNNLKPALSVFFLLISYSPAFAGSVPLPKGSYDSGKDIGIVTFDKCANKYDCSATYTGTKDGLPASIIFSSVERKGGLVTGVVYGYEYVFKGTWLEPGGSKHPCKQEQAGNDGKPTRNWGSVKFTFSPDASSWKGTWGYCNKETGGEWNGKRKQQ